MSYCTSPRPSLKGDPADAWAARAEELAEWAVARLVNRSDVWGGYRSERQIEHVLRTEGKRLPEQTTHKGRLKQERLLGHFRATDRKDVVGLHPANRDNLTRWGGLDIDRHADEDDPHANRRVAFHWHGQLCEMGFTPLLIDSNGRGGYHLRVLLREPTPANRLFHFLKELTADYQQFNLDSPPETFPKQPDVQKTPKGYGNWLRLPGRHHKREHWSRVWNGEWLEGHKAIDFIVSLEGDEVSLIPDTPRNRGISRSGDTPVSSIPPDWGKKSGASKEERLVPATRAIPATFTCTELTNREWKRLRSLVKKHQPKRKGQRNRRIFVFAQAVKGVKADCTKVQLGKIFSLWWERAKHVVGTKDEVGNYAEFRRAYKNCRYPGGFRWEKLAAEAAADPLPEEAKGYPEGVQNLVKVCARVQRLLGDQPFYLTCEEAAKQMDCTSSRTGWKVLRTLCYDGLLREVETGGRKAGKQSKATTYHYLPLLKEREAVSEGGH